MQRLRTLLARISLSQRSLALAKWLDARSALWNALAVAAAVVGLLLVYEQAELTRASNSLTRLAFEQSVRQYDESQRNAQLDAQEAQRRFDTSLAQARAASRQDQEQFQANLESTRRMAETTHALYRRELDQARETANTQAQLAQKQLAQAEQALATARESLKRAEATWLSIEDVSLDVALHQPVVARFVLRNRGRAPASSLQATCILTLIRRKQDRSIATNASAEIADTLAPGAELRLSCRLNPLVSEGGLPPEVFDELRSRQSTLVVAFPVGYNDSFGTPQFVQGCAILLPDDWKAAPCQAGENWMMPPDIRP
jgi:hypothetical protein